LPFIAAGSARGMCSQHCAPAESERERDRALLCEVREDADGVFDPIARAKADALGSHAVDPDLLIAPAWEFRTCRSGADGAPHRQSPALAGRRAKAPRLQPFDLGRRHIIWLIITIFIIGVRTNGRPADLTSGPPVAQRLLRREADGAAFKQRH
jgi:hypothetical protein